MISDRMGHIHPDRLSNCDPDSQGIYRSRSHELFLVLSLDLGCFVHSANSCDSQAKEL